MTPNNGDLEPRRPLPEVLDFAYRRGHYLRVRKLATRAISAAIGTALVATVSVYALKSAPNGPVVAATPSPNKPSPTASTTVEPTPTASESSMPSPSLHCRNSTNSKCGPFRWDPEPRNEPIRLTIEVSPKSPRVGEEVTFSVVAEDPDAQFQESGGYAFNPDFPATQPQPSGPVALPITICSTIAYGPWDLPPKTPDRMTREFRHRYEEAGTYRAVFGFETRTGGGLICSKDKIAEPQDPYGSVMWRTVEIDVRE